MNPTAPIPKPERISIRESYKEFPFNKNSKHVYYLNLTDYMKILTTIGNKKMQKMLETGEKIHEPSRTGEFHLMKFKPKKPGINFHATKKYGRTIRHTNMHTDGYAVRLHWSKKYAANFVNKNMWGINPTRTHARNISKYCQTKGVQHLFNQC